MFGKKDDEGPDLQKIHEAVQKAAGAGVHGLVARNSGTMVEVHGSADSIAAKQDAFKRITAIVGDMGLVNKIQVVQQPTHHPAAMNPMQQQHGGSNLGPTSPGGPSAGGSPMSTSSGGMRTHTVGDNETLSHIAQRYYGKASMYNKIFEANRDTLKDPDKIREGMKLRIPD